MRRGPRLTEIGEDDLLARLLRGGRAGVPGVLLGPGDDAAVARDPRGRRLLLTADLMAEGIHFRRATAAPEDVGWKLVAANASDVAAMGGIPRWALLSMALPPGLGLEWVRRLWRGLRAAGRAFGVGLVGGDTTASGGGIFLSLAVVGLAAGRVLTRTAAQAGDDLWVSGHLGAAALGLEALERYGPRRAPAACRAAVRRHLRPRPPLGFAAALASSGLARAAMDLSDGISQDLPRLCRASGVGAEVAEAALPLLASTRRAAARLGADPLRAALHGGEDYELMFAARPGAAGRLLRLGQARRVRLTRIGRFLSRRRGLRVLRAGGGTAALAPKGWEHFGRRAQGR